MTPAKRPNGWQRHKIALAMHKAESELHKKKYYFLLDLVGKTFAMALILMLIIPVMFILSGCAKSSLPPALNIYSPMVLTVEPGASIQTVDGIYTPQVKETWWSEKEYRELHDKYMDAIAR